MRRARHRPKTGRVMAIKGFGQLSGIPRSEYYLLNILSEKVLTSHMGWSYTAKQSVKNHKPAKVLVNKKERII
jgi:hypothetical protein